MFALCLISCLNHTNFPIPLNVNMVNISILKQVNAAIELNSVFSFHLVQQFILNTSLDQLQITPRK